jgi:hypothetical protein
MKKLLKELIEEHREEIKSGIVILSCLLGFYLIGAFVLWLVGYPG